MAGATEKTTGARFPAGKGLGNGLTANLFLCLLLILSGCTSTPNSPKWGEQATVLPGWSIIGREARNAALDKKTWIPLASAALLYTSGADEDISDWAVEEEPLFSGDAEDASDELKSASHSIYLLSVLATDSGDTSGEWFYNKGKGALVGATALSMVSATTDTLKEEVGRERPDETNTRSFISGHTSYTAARINLATKNLEYTPLDEKQREIVTIGLHTVTAATAWARVEGEKHYPSDVLAAIGIANFITSFMHNTFLQPQGYNATISTQWQQTGYVLNFTYRF